MTDKTLERSEKSTSHAPEPHGESPLVNEAWSRESAPASRLADDTKNVSSIKASTSFLDMGTVDALYGKSAVEPASAARVENPEGRNRKQSDHGQLDDKQFDRKLQHKPLDKTELDRKLEHNQVDYKNLDRKLDQNKPGSDQTDRKQQTRHDSVEIQKKQTERKLPDTERSTLRDRISPLRKTLKDEPTKQVAPKQEVAKPDTSKPEAPKPSHSGMHPDRLEELSRTQPDAVNRYHEDVKNVEQKKLTDWADKKLQEPERSKFKKDMREFEERAKRDGLATADVTTTYREIQRLTNATGETPLTSVERNRLAQQVMHQAAVPTSIDQGQHNTCNVATVETRTYTRTPMQAARLVADIALNGEYRATNDGTKVKLDPKAHHESLIYPTPYGARTHASEIFQVAAVNLHYAKSNAQHGTNIRYEQVEPAAGDKADHGERLMDYSVPGGKEKTDADGPVRSPFVYEDELAVVSNLISARPEKDVALVSEKREGDTNVTMINSTEELSAKLKVLKDSGQLPSIVRVNTIAEPFYTDSGAGSAGGSGGAHVVTVTDYDEKTGAVTIDNQWGGAADHGKDRPIKVHDLFVAMQTNHGVENQLKQDVAKNRENHIVEPEKEMQLLRMQKLNGHISDSDYTKEVTAVIENTHKSWQSSNVSEAQKISERRQLKSLITNAGSVDDQVALLKTGRKFDIISYEDYRTQLTFAGVKSEKAFNSSTKQSPAVGDVTTPDPVKKHDRETEILNSALSDLTPQDQAWVRSNIQVMSK